MALEIITKILFLIAVIDPLGSVPVYMEATKHFNARQKRLIAIKASIIAFFILLFFIVMGQI
ncbi:MAG: MarC family protein, partial [Luteibaculum sp.]